jgi:hypothetical protein
MTSARFSGSTPPTSRPLAATLILDGPNAHVQDTTGAEGLSGSLASVAVGGVLTLENRAVLNSTASGLANAGVVSLLGGSSLAVRGDDMQSAGASTNLAGGTVSVTGTFVNNEGATLSGSGTVAGDLMNAGLIHLDGGSGPAVLSVTGAFNQVATGALEVHLGLPGGYDQFRVGGLATLDGTLTASAPSDFAPSVGDGFDVLTYDPTLGYSGQFATVNVPDLGSELYLDPTYGTDRLTLLTRSHD